MFSRHCHLTVTSPGGSALGRAVLFGASAITLLGISMNSYAAASAETTPSTVKVSAWKSVGGSITCASGPSAVSWGSGREDVFCLGTKKQLWHKSYTRSTGKWSKWQSLGGSLSSAPDAASYGPGEIDVFARGADGKLWHKWYPKTRGGTGWSSWNKSLGAPPGVGIVGGPAAVTWDLFQFPYYGESREAVFVRGTDKQLWGRVQLGDWSSAWSRWQPLGGPMTSDPDATAYIAKPNRVDVFVRGARNNLWQGILNVNPGNGEFTGSYKTLGGTLTSGPGAWAVNMVTGHYGDEDVFIRGTGNHLWHRGYHPRENGPNVWGNWGRVGGSRILTSDPDVTYPGGPGSGHGPGVDVFARGTDNKIYYLNYFNG